MRLFILLIVVSISCVSELQAQGYVLPKNSLVEEGVSKDGIPYAYLEGSLYAFKEEKWRRVKWFGKKCHAVNDGHQYQLLKEDWSKKYEVPARPASLERKQATVYDTSVDVSDETFDREVLQADQTVLVDFTASWCGPCQVLAPKLEKLAEELAGRVKVVKMDYDTCPLTRAEYGVEKAPTMLIVSNGQVQHTLVGLPSDMQIVKDLLPKE